ncbi:MAG: hypothetical protein WCF81_16745 [Roseiarcus sp.]
MNILAIERGFDDFIANVSQRGVDKATDKGALIAWLNGQLDEWETKAEHEAERGTEVLWEGGPVRPFPADDVIRWIEQALDRIDAFPESEWARRRAMRGLMQQITELETAVDAEDFDEAAKASEQVLAGIKGLAGAPAIP